MDEVILSIDKDRRHCETLKSLYLTFSSFYQLAFANGGDQNNESMPEAAICKELGIELIKGLGDKVQSSSWLLNR